MGCRHATKQDVGRRGRCIQRTDSPPGTQAVKKTQVTKKRAGTIPKITRQKQVLPVPVRTEQEARNLGGKKNNRTPDWASVTSSTLRAKIVETATILDGKKASLRQTCDNQTKANDKDWWDLNRKTEKALETLAIFYVRFEQGIKGSVVLDPKFDK